MSNLTDFARSELERAKMFSADGDFYGGMMGPAVMKMIEIFADEGHSGMSASVAISLFSRLAKFEPITPLTGEDDEWTEIQAGYWQNRRCSHIFKKNGEAYDSEGRIFREPNGVCYQNRESRVPVAFPYTPKTVYVDVPASDAEKHDKGPVLMPWIIERYVNSELRYFSDTLWRSGHTPEFDADFDRAIKFHDKDSADRILGHLCDGIGRVAEHQYIEDAALNRLNRELTD